MLFHYEIANDKTRSRKLRRIHNMFKKYNGQCFKISLQRVHKPLSCKIPAFFSHCSCFCENFLNELKFGITQ